MRITNFLNDTVNKFKAHSPAILTSLGVAGLVTTTFLTIDATIKIKEDFDIRKQVDKNYDKYTFKDKAVKTWRYWLPPAISFGFTTASIILANTENAKKYSALMTAYTMSERTIRDLQSFKEKAKDKMTEEQYKEIDEQVRKERASYEPINDNTVIFTGDGTQLCYDEGTCQYFYSNEKVIEHKVNELNKTIKNHDSIAVEDYCNALNINVPQFCREQVWFVNKDFIDIYTHFEKTKDGSPCLHITHRKLPIDYRFAY